MDDLQGKRGRNFRVRITILVIPSEARNLLSLAAGKQQTLRRYAPQNDKK